MAPPEDDGWSPIATEWATRWGGFADPARRALLDAAAVGTGVRLLDAGCGSGELLRLAADRGAAVAGCDPSPAMLAVAGRSAPEADLRTGGLEALPWPDGAFDVVTAVNALHLADQGPALAEVRRVLAPGGLLALAGWAERSRNELGVLEAAVAAADGEPPAEDPEDRLPGGLEAVLAAGGFALVAADLVEATWTAVDDEALVAGVLLGEDVGTKGELGPAVVAAAAPFRSSDGVVRLRNHLRWAVGRR
ncbi:hypothetical protein GCM10025783_00040 [Amnibacterium soli]|uniref:Methyltransferase type 11 domain-containing protein n=1 Tax=Amnibacterium soli TaxID=1282736 RepID=A0ABP8YNL6_9MICO